MQENVINIRCEGRTLKADPYTKPTRYSVGHDFVKFELGEEWEGLSKYLTFYNDFVSVSPIEYADKVEVPSEVLRYKTFRVTIEGSEDGTDRLLTASMRYPIHVDESGKNDGDEPTSPTKTVLTKLTELGADLEAKRDSGYFKGEKGDPGEDGSIKFEDLTPEQKEQLRGYPGKDGKDGVSITNPRIENGYLWVDIVKQLPDGLVDTERKNLGRVKGSNGAYVSNATVNAQGHLIVEITDTSNGMEVRYVDAGYVKGADGNDGSDAQATDVQINGTSITSGGVANIPLAAPGTEATAVAGVVKPSATFRQTADGRLGIVNPPQSVISARESGYALTTSTYDGAVKAAMTDGKGAAWTDAEKKAARGRIGLGDSFELIEQVTLTENSRIVRFNEPDGTPYKFKDLTVTIEWGGATQSSGYTILVVNGQRCCLVNQATLSHGKVTVVSSHAMGGTLLSFSIPQTDSLNGATNVYTTPNAMGINPTSEITGFYTDSVTVSSGSTVSIYGVRA